LAENENTLRNSTMPTPILMPALSPTMEEGKLARWLVKEGDKVSSGDVIAEIETDKATMEVEAVDEGTVGKILVPEGTEGVAVNATIAMLLEEGEDKSALQSTPAAAAKPAAAKQDAPARAGAPESTPAQAATPAKANGANGHGRRVFASPLARRVAQEKAVDIAALTGSGPHGRVVLRDVQSAIESGVAPAARAAAAAPQAQALVPAAGGALPMQLPIPDEQVFAIYQKGSYDLVPHDNMRKTIATRLTQAKMTIPHFYLTIDCELDTLMEARQRLNQRSPKDEAKAYRLSVNDFIIKAMGLALMRVPAANASFTTQGMLMHKHADVGVAVAIDGGLFTPVIRSVEEKSLVEISQQMRDMAERARKRRLAPHEYQGGATAISNLGMYAVKHFDAVINPPQSTILAVGQSERRPVVKGNNIEIATMMTVTLSCDHRVVDGALGAQLLAAFKGFIEEPVTMLL
jgi:pyruvate dehydrogenase E2 component (dihydrolipoamide acetyltransferase)